MGAVREGLTALVAVTLLLTAAQALVPEGTLRRLSGLIGGLILLVTVLRPLLGVDLERLDLGLEDYEDAIQERQAELEAAGKSQLTGIIEDRTAAYISDKADALGIAVTVRVTARPGPDGVPLPWQAELTGPRSPELAACMDRELGIPPERQVWNEVEN